MIRGTIGILGLTMLVLTFIGLQTVRAASLEKIVYESGPGWQTNQPFDLYIMNEDGTDRQRLTTSPTEFAGDSFQAALTIDGKKMAFGSYRDTPRTRISELYTGDLNVSKGHYELANVQRWTFSEYVDDWQPTWGPDCKSLVFVSDRESLGHTALYWWDFVSTPVRLMDPGEGADSTPVWSPTTREIAFLRRTTLKEPDELMVYDLDTNHEEPLSVKADAIAWHPQGGKILYGGWDGQIYEITTSDRSKSPPLTTPPKDYGDYGASYSSTGEKIAFTRWKNNDPNANGAIYVKTFAAGTEEDRTKDPSRHYQTPVWVRSGACPSIKNNRPSVSGPVK